MPTCEQVRARLPGIVAGEPSDEPLREHVARCPACRAEREALQRATARVREDLAALAPSPFLEDAVIEVAHAAEAAGPAPRRWLPAAVAAAAVLLLFVLVPRPGGRGAPSGDAGRGADEGTVGVPGIGLPPSADRVARARLENAGPFPDAATWKPSWRLVRSVTDAGVGPARMESGFTPAPSDVLHRWSMGPLDGAIAPVVLGIGLPAPRGTLLLGTGLLARLGDGVLLHQDGATVLDLPDGRRWHTTPGTPDGELVLSSPVPGGPEARVRVRVSTGYTGTLMVEEPLARALGLHLVELRGGWSVEGWEPALRGSRAMARVRVPELGVDEVVEVQVLASVTPPPLAPPDRIAVRGARLRGVLPDEVRRRGPGRMDLGPEADPGAPVLDGVRDPRGHPLEVPIDPDGPRQLVLVYHPRADLGARGLPADAWVVPPAVDLASLDDPLPAVEVTTLDLPGPFPPHARLVLARVWRGTTAIPSREGVTTCALGPEGAPDGLSLPRVAGETGATLRLLVASPDGTSSFRDVVVDPALLPRPVVSVRLTDDGALAVDGATVGRFGPLGLGVLGALHQALAARADAPGLRDASGASWLDAHLVVDRRTPWPQVQAVLVELASLGISRLRFATDEAGDGLAPLVLPTDTGLGADRPGPAVVLRVTPEDDHLVAEARFGTSTDPAMVGWWPSAERPLGDATEVLPFLLAQHARTGGRRARIEVPATAQVPWGILHALIRTLEEAGLDEVVLALTP